MRNIILIGESFDQYNVQLVFSEVFWIPVVLASQQVPLPATFVSAVPLASSATSTVWQTYGATSAEMLALQIGTVREFVQLITIPLVMFNDTGAAQVADAFYRVYYAKVNGGAGTVPNAVIPSSVNYVGANGVVSSTTVAAASNGASLPQTTLNVASTTGFPSSGTLFVPTSISSGPQAGQIVVQPVTYTGTTATTFTGCTGGTGTLFTGGIVNVQTFTAG